LKSPEGSQVVARGSVEATGSKFLTVNMVCDVKRETCYKDTTVPRMKRVMQG